MNEFSQFIKEDESKLADFLERECERLRGTLAKRIPRSMRSLLSVDDVLQQSCVDVFQSIHQVHLADKPAFSNWFETIARRNLIDAIRSLSTLKRGGGRQKFALQSPSQSHSSLLGQLFTHSLTASKQAMAAELLSRLQTAICKLPDHYRAVIEKYDLQQQSIEETAQSLGKSVGATFMIRGRAHRLLASMLESSIP